MTDKELNIALATAFNWETFVMEDAYSGDGVITKIDTLTLLPAKVFDFNDWSDLMPLIEKYGINYEGCNDYGFIAYKYRLSNEENDFYTRGKILQRALAECLLKVVKNLSNSAQVNEEEA